MNIKEYEIFCPGNMDISGGVTVCFLCYYGESKSKGGGLMSAIR